MCVCVCVSIKLGILDGNCAPGFQWLNLSYHPGVWGGGLWMAVRVRVALTEGAGAGEVRGGARGEGVTEPQSHESCLRNLMYKGEELQARPHDADTQNLDKKDRSRQ